MSHSVCTRLHGSPLESQAYLPQHPSVTFLHAPALPPQMTMQRWHLEAPKPDAEKGKKVGIRERRPVVDKRPSLGRLMPTMCGTGS